MNIVSTLTLRHIKTHKKRSILTVLAIIVSVAMVTAVFTSAISFVKYFQNASMANDGNWHAKFYDDDYELHKAYFATDENIEEFSVRTNNGFVSFGDETLPQRSSVFSGDEKWFSMRNITVSEGRLPQNSHELLLTSLVIEDYGLEVEIGDKITLPLSVYDKETEETNTVNTEYEIVGITNSRVSATDYDAIFSGIDSEALKNSIETIVLARYNRLDNSIWDKMEATSESTGLEQYSYHTDLFMYSGIAKNNSVLISLGTFAGILLLIIAVVSVFMIYDSFAVSYQERARYLGMLASVGATKKQKRFSIYFEGFILGLIGIPLGIISGIGGIAVTFMCIQDAFMKTLSVDTGARLRVYVNWIVIAGSVLASALTIFVSSYIPAKKASKSTPIEAIKRQGTVKVKNPKRLRVSKLTSKIFGYEGALAVKNFKRNGKRSRNIVFALFLSVVVFLTAANFSSMFADTLNVSLTETVDALILADLEKSDELQKAVAQNKDVDRFYLTATKGIKLESSVFKDGEESKIMSDNKNALIVFLDNASFDKHLKRIGEDTEKYHVKSKPLAVLQNVSYQKKDGKSFTAEPVKDIEGSEVKAGIQITTDENENPIYRDISLNIGKQTTEQWDEKSFGYQYTQYPILYLSMDFAEQYLTDEQTSGERAQANIFAENAKTVCKEITDSLEAQGIDASSVTTSSSAESMNNLLKIARVFIYGFITLISIISIMNIINTISNSMNERRREFAMIRSVGMTPKNFRKMIYFEAFRYGAKALIFALPVGELIHFALYKALSGSFDFGFKLNFLSCIVAIAAVFAVIGISLLYSLDKIRGDNIIETLKTDID